MHGDHTTTTGGAASRTGIELDHVLLVTPDLDDAADELLQRYGLTSVVGGRHEAWGTANRIVPVGEAYLELVTVVDRDRALRTDFGRWVANAPAQGIHPLGWAVRTPAIGAVAERLGLVVHSGSRTTPDHRTLDWQTAGVERAIAEPALPFFIRWGRDTPHPSRAVHAHPAGTVEIARLELRGDPGRLSSWLGDHRLPVVVSPDEPAIERIVLRGSAGEFELSDR